MDLINLENSMHVRISPLDLISAWNYWQIKTEFSKSKSDGKMHPTATEIDNKLNGNPLDIPSVSKSEIVF